MRGFPEYGLLFDDSLFDDSFSFSLYEAFGEEVFGVRGTDEGSEARVPLSSYATRVRRELVEIAGKLVKTGRQVILKVTEATARRLDIDRFFRQVANPPRFAWRELAWRQSEGRRSAFDRSEETESNRRGPTCELDIFV